MIMIEDFLLKTW